MRVELGDVASIDVKAVFLDGIEVLYCTAFDIKAGYVEQFVLDEHNRPKLFVDRLLKRRLTGRVYVQWLGKWKDNPFLKEVHETAEPPKAD